MQELEEPYVAGTLLFFFVLGLVGLLQDVGDVVEYGRDGKRLERADELDDDFVLLVELGAFALLAPDIADGCHEWHRVVLGDRVQHLCDALFDVDRVA